MNDPIGPALRDRREASVFWSHPGARRTLLSGRRRRPKTHMRHIIFASLIASGAVLHHSDIRLRAQQKPVAPAGRLIEALKAGNREAVRALARSASEVN